MPLELTYLSPSQSLVRRSFDINARTSSVDPLLLHDNTLPRRVLSKDVYYKPYLWARKLEDSGWKWESMNYCLRSMILVIVTCPFIWWSVTTFVNLYEGFAWGFSYPGVLWVVYFTATVSIIFDYIVNTCLILSVGAEKVVMNNMLGDFVLICAILSACLIPMMYEVSTNPDDEFNSTFTQMSVNLLDSFSIIALTGGNIVLNKLVESVIHTAVFNKLVYLEADQGDYIDLEGNVHSASTVDMTKPGGDETRSVQSDAFATPAPSPRSGVGARLSLTDPSKLAHAATTSTASAKTPPAQIKSMLKFVVSELQNSDGKRKNTEHLYMYSLLETMIDEYEPTSTTGRFRFCLRAKMTLNLASSTLFAFYSSVYLSAKNGCYIFVLFLTVLSFLNNLTSATVVKVHDDAVKLTYADEAFETVLSIGKFNGFDHVQFYTTTVISLVNLAFRVSVTKAN